MQKSPCGSPISVRHPWAGTARVGAMQDRGLAADGTIAREGAPERVTAAFAPVVASARARLVETFVQRAHSAYLYGSVPRGTAIPGTSDLDLLLALHREPTEADRADAGSVERALDRGFDQIDGVGLLLAGVDTVLSELERHDLGFFVACLCTPPLRPGSRRAAAPLPPHLAPRPGDQRRSGGGPRPLARPRHRRDHRRRTHGPRQERRPPANTRPRRAGHPHRGSGPLAGRRVRPPSRPQAPRP